MGKGLFLSQVRLTLLKWMEALGTTASTLASNAKLKAAEINLENHRREILSNFSLRAFEMWQKGVKLPDPLSEMLSELSETDDRLSVIRAQKYARVVPTEQKPEAPAEPEPAQEEPVTCTLNSEDGESVETVVCDVEDAPPEPEEAETAEEPAPEAAEAKAEETEETGGK